MSRINKTFSITLLILILIFGGIFLWNIARNYLIKIAIKQHQPVISVATTKAKLETWQPYLYAVGTLIATNGVSVSSQEAGKIVKINFASGQRVKKDDLLIQLDDRTEQAQLQNNQAALKLAEITYLRNKALLQNAVVSKQAFDEATARYQQAQASVRQTQAIIDYKHITAPFGGIVGIRNVNLGQYVRPGDNLVSLQALDPLYVNFYLPEKFLHRLFVGQSVSLTVDAIPNRNFIGKINALNSLVDVQTHNITIQAIIPNPEEKLYPGLFAKLRVILPMRENVVTVPQTAINYSLYGDTVYVVKREGRTKDNRESARVFLREVDTGDQKENRIIITKGLKAGEEVVTSGQLKLNNEQSVVINNDIQP